MQLLATISRFARLSLAPDSSITFSKVALIAGCIICFISPPARAQQPSVPADPSDLFFHIYLYERDGIKHLNNQAYDQSIENLSKGLELTWKVKRDYPKWRPESIQKRTENIQRLLTKAEQQRLGVAQNDIGLYDSKATPHSPADSKIASIDHKIKQLETQLQTSSSANLRPQSNRRTDTTQKDALIQRLKESITTLKKEQKVIINDGIKSRQEARKSTEELARLRTENQNLQQDIAETVDSYQRKISALETDLKKAKETSQDPTNDTALANLEVELKDQKESKDAELKFLYESKTDLQTKISSKEQATKTKDQALTKQSELISTYQNKLKKYESELAAAQSNQEESARLQNLLEQQITALKNERELLLSRPLRSEIDAIEGQLNVVKQQKQSLSQALNTNEKKYYEAVDRIGLFQKELVAARNTINDLQASMQSERTASNDVIEGLRLQLEDANNALDQKNTLLGQEQARVTELQTFLSETKDHYAELQTNYDALSSEHALMKEMLAADDLTIIKKRSLTLQEELNLAKSRLNRLSKQEEATQNDLNIAKKQYAITRTELVKMQHNLELSELRADKLMGQLEQTRSELELAEAKSQGIYPTEDVTMLKKIINRQMNVQQKRKLSRNLILEEVKRLGIDDELFLGALDLADTQELELNASEQALLGDRKADDEFRFNDRASPEERAAAQERLNERIAIHESLGRESYTKGRYAASEEFFQTILDEHPGHVPSMINLGVAKLRKSQHDHADEYDQAIQLFEDAISMRTGSELPFAHLMIGYTHFVQKQYEEATEQFYLCLEQNPLEAKAHLFLGAIAAKVNDSNQAESHLKKALEIEPTLTDPEYNLSVLYLGQKKYNDARNAYQSAIRKGAAPDLQFETKLKRALLNERF